MSVIFDRSPEEQYGLDFEVKMQELVPIVHQTNVPGTSRKVGYVDLAEVLFNGLAFTNGSLVSLVAEIRKRLSFTGQVLSLEKFLNDTFDNVLRRITIACLNAVAVDFFAIFLNSEGGNDELIFYANADVAVAPITIFLQSDITGGEIFGVDFNINVPNDITLQDDVIRAFADIYVVAPQSYDIIRF